ncbi:MAG: TonB-dependent receptor [Cytophagales bacterium]|nr:TonB-dependent receptor [Cytophagales bacterium]
MGKTKIRHIANVLVFLLSIDAHSQAVYSIGGIVLTTDGKPIPNVVLHIHENMLAVQTDSTGKFIFNHIKPGHYHLHAELLGYKSYETHIDLPELTYLYITLYQTTKYLDEVVIESAPLKTTNAQNSFKTDKITQQYFERNSSNTLMNTLEMIPGISAINMGIGVSKPVIRGLSMSNIAVTDNGIKQEGQQWGSDHGLEIDQYSVDEVEILKGPSALMYGSDAIGGVINIIQPKILHSNVYETKIMGIYRSNNDTYGVSAGANGNKNGNIFRVRLTGLQYADYKVPAAQFNYNRYTLPIYEGRLKNTAGNEVNASVMCGLNRSWGYSHLTVSNYHQNTGIFAGAAGIPRSYQLTHDGNFRDISLPNQNVNHFKIIINNSLKIRHNWLTHDAGYQYNLRNEYSKPEAFLIGLHPLGNLALNLRLHTFTNNIRYFININEKIEVLTGLQTSQQINNTNGYEYVIPNFLNIQTGAYFIAKYKPNIRLTYNFGIRYDAGYAYMQAGKVNYYDNVGTLLNTEIRSYAFSRLYHNWASAVGLSYFIHSQVNIKINIGKSFRLPTPQELSANGYHHGTFRYEKGDSSLSPMSGYQADVGLYYDNKKYNSGFTPFFNYFANYIYSKATASFVNKLDVGQLYQFSQSEAYFWGAEWQNEYYIHKHFTLRANTDYVYAHNLSTGLPLPFIPPFSVFAEVEYSTPIATKYLHKCYAKYSISAYESQQRVDRNEKPTQGYILMHLGLGIYVGKQYKDRIGIHLQIQNLADVLYINHLSRYKLLNLPEQGRNVVFNIVVKM